MAYKSNCSLYCRMEPRMLQGERKEGSLVDHLEELRWAIIRALLSVVAIFPVAYYFSDALTELLLRHLCPSDLKLRYFSPVEPLFVKLKMSLYLSGLVAAPYVLRQIWGFVAPGLYLREKRFAGFLLSASCLLFVAGVAFSLWFILPLVMTFSVGFQTPYLEAAIGFEQFVSLVGLLAIGFGIMFQCPALVFVLIYTGIVSLERVVALRPVILVAILVISALLTPPDVFSQLMMAIPTWLLFEAGVLLARLFCRRPS